MHHLTLRQAVGMNCPNLPDDVKAIHQHLMKIGKIPQYESTGTLDDSLILGIFDVQSHFMLNPDLRISVGGQTHTYLTHWSNKIIQPNVRLPGRLKEAWDWVDPLLPEGSTCESGYRTIEEQRRILHDLFLGKYRSEIISKYGIEKYNLAKNDLLTHEPQVVAMVNGVGQAIAAPGQSMHQKGLAIDIGGHYTLDRKQVEIVRLVAQAHPGLLSGKVMREKNGCVHFEIRPG